MNFPSRHTIALVLLTVTLCGLLTSFSENVVCAGELPGLHESASATCGHDGAQLHDGSTPCEPAHSDDDHICLGDCGCPCQAPLPAMPVAVMIPAYGPPLSFAEPLFHLPEVFLSKFIPPQNLA